MKLSILGSSSSGNGYILQNRSEAIMIEAGMRFKVVEKAVDYEIHKIKGCLISHSHGDHSKYVSQVAASGIDIYASKGTIDALSLSGRKIKQCKELEQFNVGNFLVTPFLIVHDAPEPLGFLINHPESGNVLFLTDTWFTQYNFPDLSNIIIECNYEDDILQKNVDSGRIHKSVYDRVKQSHMSLSTLKRLLKANDLTSVNNIVLIHLSSNNSNETLFKQEIESVTGKTVTIAKSGIEIEFNKQPF